MAAGGSLPIARRRLPARVTRWNFRINSSRHSQSCAGSDRVSCWRTPSGSARPFRPVWFSLNCASDTSPIVYLILTPAGLREQWAQELRARFNIDSESVNAAALRRRVATLAAGLNPWITIPVAIASIDYVKRPEVLPAIACCRWDVLVVDEAHGAAGSSDRHGAVSVLAARAGYLLLLTATPHSGDPRAFVSLCDLGSDGDPLLVFRRTRADVHVGGRRRVHRLHVQPSVAESRMHRLLREFTRAVRAEHGDSNRDLWLALSVLHKRALSSPRSLEQTLLRRVNTLAGIAEGAAAQLPLGLSEEEGIPPTDLRSGFPVSRSRTVPASWHCSERWRPRPTTQPTARRKSRRCAGSSAASPSRPSCSPSTEIRCFTSGRHSASTPPSCTVACCARSAGA